MSGWREYKAKRPLRGEARRAYEAAREAMGVGYLILKARADAGLTQEGLAKKIGTSQPMVARWESGRQVPSVRSLMRIAEATSFELAVGLRKPGEPATSFQVLEVLQSSGKQAKGFLLKEAAG
jgi:transcriptional regulator with XRE-family HTH domain